MESKSLIMAAGMLIVIMLVPSRADDGGRENAKRVLLIRTVQRPRLAFRTPLTDTNIAPVTCLEFDQIWKPWAGAAEGGTKVTDAKVKAIFTPDAGYLMALTKLAPHAKTILDDLLPYADRILAAVKPPAE
jgi:hypothetical protein